MASLNKCIFIGNLGREPESRTFQDGSAVSNFSIACTDTWKDKQTGEKKEMTEWVRISTFGKLAEICNQYLKKGQQVYIEGSLRARKWTDKDGQARYTTEIRADVMKMLGSKASSQSAPDDGYTPPESGQTEHGAAKANGYAPGFDDLGDDIPF